MLVDVMKFAKDEWVTFTGRDLEIMNKVSIKSAQAAAEIAKGMGHLDVANEIMERALNP